MSGKRLRGLALLLVAIMLAACSGNDSHPTSPSAPNPWEDYLGDWHGTREIRAEEPDLSFADFDIDLSVRPDGTIEYVYQVHIWWENYDLRYGNTVIPIWNGSSAAWGDSSIDFISPSRASYQNETVGAGTGGSARIFRDICLLLDKQ